jgi:predicted DNA-binding transcriptional regulator AlpA
MSDKLADHLAYPPRALRADRAAAYLSMSRTTFLQLVDEGILPKPIHIRAMATWDRLELDAAYDSIKESAGNSIHRLLQERLRR